MQSPQDVSPAGSTSRSQVRRRSGWRLRTITVRAAADVGVGRENRDRQRHGSGAGCEEAPAMRMTGIMHALDIR
jgi:hypothetical protein